MADKLKITTEQVDDIPILLAQGKKIGVPEILDQHFWPHGNWQGTSFGWTAMVWLAHILSEGEHRLNQVEQWAEKRLHTLEMGTGQRVRGLNGVMIGWGSYWTNWRMPRDGKRLRPNSTGTPSECTI